MKRLVCLSAFFLLASSESLCKEMVSIKDNEVWITDSAGGSSKKVTEDHLKKDSPCICPDGTKIAYYILGRTQVDPVGEVFVIDRTGREIWHGVVRSQEGQQCPSILSVEWIDNERLGVCTHANPSVSKYHEISSGRTVRSLYLSGSHSWSPDRKHLAYGGPIPHFSPGPLGSDYLKIDQAIVFPDKRNDEGRPLAQNKAPAKHEFTTDFHWSPDSKAVAFCDRIEEKFFVADKKKMNWVESPNAACSQDFLIVASVRGTFSKCRLPFRCDRSKTKIQWKGSGTVSVSTAGKGRSVYFQPDRFKASVRIE